MEDMKPGRELDALVAEKVMGCKVGTQRIEIPGTRVRIASRDETGVKEPYEMVDERTLYFCRCAPFRVHNADEGGIPQYSTDISEAFEVVHALETQGWGFILDNIHHYLGNWQAHFEKDGRAVSIDGGSAPHAICLAALEAHPIQDPPA